VELICDGVHVEANVVKILADVLGSRLMVVSDACPVAGLGDGDFKLGSMPARVVVAAEHPQAQEPVVKACLAALA